MIIQFFTPISTSERNLIIVDGSCNFERIIVDYKDEKNTYFHCSIRNAENIIVFNDFMDGAWGEELRVPMSSLQSGLLIIEIYFSDNGIDVKYCEHVHKFERGTKIHLSRYVDSNVPVNIVRLNNYSTVNSPDDGGICIQVDRADISGFGGKIWLNDQDKEGLLIAFADDRAVSKQPLAILYDQPVYEDGSRLFTFAYDEGALIRDGMSLSLCISIAPEIEIGRAVIRSNYRGAIDRCSELGVRGWVANLNDFHTPVLIEVYLNDEYQGSAVADRRRQDLLAINSQMEYTGFIFRFPKTLFFPENTDQHVKVLVRGAHFELAHSPWYICRKSEL